MAPLVAYAASCDLRVKGVVVGERNKGVAVEISVGILNIFRNLLQGQTLASIGAIVGALSALACVALVAGIAFALALVGACALSRARFILSVEPTVCERMRGRSEGMRDVV